MRTVLTKRLSILGFIVSDFAAHRPDFLRDMSAWVGAGKVKYKEYITEGLDNGAFMGLRAPISASNACASVPTRRDRRRAFGSAVRRGQLPGPTLLISHASHRLCVDRSMAAARSPMITHGAIVLPVATLGMTDPSATRSLSIP